MADIKFNLLGSPIIKTQGQTLELPNRKALGLLIYLAESGEAHSREHLAALLWPDLSKTRALANLRRTLWLINQTEIGAAILFTSETISFDQEQLRTDTASVEKYSDLLQDELAPDTISEMEGVAAQIRGDFLAEFTIPDSDAFETWTSEKREFLRSRTLRLLDFLTDHALEQEAFNKAQELAWKQITFDNLRESGYRQLMRALAGANQHSAALAQYETLRRLMQREPGMEPDAETRSLYDQIRARSLARRNTAAAAASGEARFTTFMFTDIEGSTPLWDRHRQAMLVALMKHNRIIEEQVERFGGSALENRGDGFLIVFENGDPLDAALEIQRQMAETDWGEIDSLRIRIGLHGTTSEWEGYDFFRAGEEYHGPLLNHAARVMEACWGGQILSTDIVKSQLTLPEGASWVDFGEHRIKGAEEPVHLFGLVHPELAQKEFAPPRTETEAMPQDAAWAEATSPYRGLYAFREEDAPFFFGREAFSERILEQVQKRSMVAVIGPSGIGKSSVVYAGLLAQLRQQGGWKITAFRPGSRPFQSLATALMPLLEPQLRETDQLVEINKLSTALRQADISLMDVVRRILDREPSGTRFPLVADQFEELYTLVPEADIRTRFMDTLTDAVFDQDYRENPVFSLILTLRVDFLGQALTHRPFADAIQESDVKLGPMTRSELSRAIINPAQKLEVDFEAGLAQRILDDVGDEPGNLPLLEFALAMLWERHRDNLMTHAAYEEIERVDGALARHADAVFGELSTEDQQRAHQIFTQVVRPGEGTEDTRRLATRSELGDQSWPLVQHLADQRLLVTGRNAGGDETVEVVHEALIRGWGQLRAWMAADRDFRLWQERLRAALRSWQATGQDEGALLRGVSLTAAETWVGERPRDISPAEADFIQASTALRDNQQIEANRRRRRRVFALAGGMLVALFLAVLASIGWNNARLARLTSEQNAAISQSLALAANALQVYETGDRELALALAVEAVDIDSPPLEAERALEQIATSTSTRMVLEGHEGPVSTFTILPDEKRLLSGGGFPDPREQAAGDYSLRLWDMQSGELLHIMEGHRWNIVKIAVTSDGRTAVTASDDGSLIVWDLETGQARLTFEGHSRPVKAVFINPAGTRVLSLSQTFPLENQTGLGENQTGSELIGWELQTGRELYRLEHAPEEIRHMDVSSDGSLALLGMSLCDKTGCQLGTAQLLLFDVERGEVVDRVDFEAPSMSGVWGLDITPDGNFAVALITNFSVEAPSSAEEPPEDLMIGLYILLPAAKVLNQVEFNPSNTAGIPDYPLFSPDGTRVAMNNANEIWIADADSGDDPLILGGRTGIEYTSRITYKNFSPDGNWLVSGGLEGAIIIWEAESGDAVFLLDHHDGPVTEVRFTTGRPEMITASADGTLRIWALVTDQNRPGLEPARVLHAHNNENLVYVSFTADGRHTFSVGSRGDQTPSEAVLWDWQADQVVYHAELPETFIPHFGVIHPDGERAIIGGFSTQSANISFGSEDNQGTLIEWDLENGRALRTVTLADTAEFLHLAFSPDGRSFLTGGARGIMRLWDLEDLRVTGTYAPPEPTVVYGVAFSPDGRYGMATDGDGLIYQWDLAQGEVVRTYEHGGLTTSIAFSPDGTQFLSTSEGDKSLVLWDFDSGQELKRMLGHTLGVSSAVFLPDGDRAISSAADGTLILWDLTTGEALRHFREHFSWIWRVALSPDGTMAASASQDGTVIVRSLGGYNREALLAFVEANRYVPDFTCEQRELFRIAPLCSP